MRWLLFSALTASLAVPAPALACTLCHEPTALGVRHLLFQHEFWSHAAALATPLALLLMATLAVNRRIG